MKNIILESLELINFKGIKSIKIDFSNTTNISGDNGTGKTTIVDAFFWLLFDKDSTNRSDFEIKTLTPLGEAIHNLDHIVIAVLNIDGKQKMLSKIYREVWTKPKLQTEKFLTSHTTIYSIDDVPFKKSEYQKFINELVDEKIFKIITNPFYFSTQLKWEERRNILIELADEVKVKQSKFLAELLEDKTEEQLRDSLRFKKNKLNEEFKFIPARIDEVNNTFVKIDNELLSEKSSYQSRLEEVENSILTCTDPFKSDKETLAIKRKELNTIELIVTSNYNSKVQELNAKLNDNKGKLLDIKYDFESTEKSLVRYEQELLKSENKITELRIEFDESSKIEFVFDDELSNCPTCKQSLPLQEVENNKDILCQNFNADKSSNLNRLNGIGTVLKNQIEEYTKKIIELKAQAIILLDNIGVQTKLIKVIEADIVKAEKLKTKYPAEHKIILTEILEIETRVNTPTSEEQKTFLIKAKNHLSENLSRIKVVENDVELNSLRTERIQELENSEKNLSQQIADIEKTISELENYIKDKSLMLEKNINSKFGFVKFKLFDLQINGGLALTCVPLINGVPFTDANNAAKYNAGLDIINTLVKFFNCSAPIFIDNREGINEIIQTDSQLVNLYVNNDKKLSINKFNEVA